MSKVFVFDFDGTIANSSDIIFDVLDNYVPDLTKEKYLEEMRSLFLKRTWYEILRAFYLELKLKSSAKKISIEIGQKILEAKLITDIEPILRKLKQDGNILIILSSNFKENIIEFLKRKNLDIFNEVNGEGHILRKYQHLREIKKKYPNQEIFYIGDELRDIDTARIAGVKEVAVTWGLNTRKDFEDMKVKCILDKPEELMCL